MLKPIYSDKTPACFNLEIASVATEKNANYISLTLDSENPGSFALKNGEMLYIFSEEKFLNQFDLKALNPDPSRNPYYNLKLLKNHVAYVYYQLTVINKEEEENEELDEGAEEETHYLLVLDAVEGKVLRQIKISNEIEDIFCGGEIVIMRNESNDVLDLTTIKDSQNIRMKSSLKRFRKIKPIDSNFLAVGSYQYQIEIWKIDKIWRRASKNFNWEFDPLAGRSYTDFLNGIIPVKIDKNKTLLIIRIGFFDDQLPEPIYTEEFESRLIMIVCDFNTMKVLNIKDIEFGEHQYDNFGEIAPYGMIKNPKTGRENCLLFCKGSIRLKKENEEFNETKGNQSGESNPGEYENFETERMFFILEYDFAARELEIHQKKCDDIESDFLIYANPRMNYLVSKDNKNWKMMDLKWVE